MKNNMLKLVTMVAFAGVLGACTPAAKNEIVEIGSNETAFMIKMDGDSAKEQTKFQSEEILNQNKIARVIFTI